MVEKRSGFHESPTFSLAKSDMIVGWIIHAAKSAVRLSIRRDCSTDATLDFTEDVMSVVINSNAAATVASNNLAASNSLLQKSLNRLSSGSKIVSPADDAGGLAVSMKLSATAKRQNAVKSNLGNTASFLETQDGALKVTGKILDRISELKVMYGDVTKSATDRSNYNTEYLGLRDQLTAINQESFNGIKLFGTTSLTVGLTEKGSAGSQLSINGVNLVNGTADNFSGNSIDAGKWTTSLPYGDSAIAQASGILNSDNRGYLVSTGDFASPLTIDVTATGSGTNTSASLAWKTDGTHTGPASTPTDGLSFNMFYESQTVSLAQAGGSYVNTPFSLVLGTSYSFRVVDGGSVAKLYLSGQDTPLLTFDYNETTVNSSGKVSFFSRENIGNAHTASLDNISISSGSTVSSIANTDSLANLDLSTVTTSIQDVATFRAQNGANQSRLGYATEMLTVNEANLEAANSRIIDVDVAAESTALARSNILVQAGTSMLSQANQSAQMVLKLLSG